MLRWKNAIVNGQRDGFKSIRRVQHHRQQQLRSFIFQHQPVCL